MTGVLPATGGNGGGTPVTISGTGFVAGGTAVTIGGVAAAGVSVAVGGTSLTAITPPGTVGAASDIVVTTPGGNATLPASFTYYAGPAVTTVTPAVGPVAGATPVTITGTNLGGITSVTFGGNPATGVTVNGAGTSLTATTPAGAGWSGQCGRRDPRRQRDGE